MPKKNPKILLSFLLFFSCGFHFLLSSEKALSRVGINSNVILPQHTDEDNLLRIISYNIASSFLDYKDKTIDQHHHWCNRKQKVFQLIQECNPDIFATQEASPEQAYELATTFKHEYESLYLTQAATEEVEPGIIYHNTQVLQLKGKDTGTFLLGLHFKKEKFELVDQGRFWLKEDPDQIPIQNEIDKGFGNTRTSRAVFWIRLSSKTTGKQILIANSHYPIDGGNRTRLQCAQLENQKMQENVIDWVAVGDKNIRPDETTPRDIRDKVYQSLVQGIHEFRDSYEHYGPAETWIGFEYDQYKVLIKEGQLAPDDINNTCIDIGITNMQPIRSFHLLGAYDRYTGKLNLPDELLQDYQNEERYFISDHMLIGADFHW